MPHPRVDEIGPQDQGHVKHLAYLGPKVMSDRAPAVLLLCCRASVRYCCVNGVCFRSWLFRFSKNTQNYSRNKTEISRKNFILKLELVIRNSTSNNTEPLHENLRDGDGDRGGRKATKIRNL